MQQAKVTPEQPAHGMKQATVTRLSSQTYAPVEEWEEGECLCEGKVPEGKRVEYANKVYRERDKRWVWKVWLRLHIDCPVHGCNPDIRKKD